MGRADVVLTCSAVMRGAKSIPLKSIVDKAIDLSTFKPDHVLVIYSASEALISDAQSVLYIFIFTPWYWAESYASSLYLRYWKPTHHAFLACFLAKLASSARQLWLSPCPA
jgi:acyl-coenzyme A synthetase/AMP-(fatty) acid ligase